MYMSRKWPSFSAGMYNMPDIPPSDIAGWSLLHPKDPTKIPKEQAKASDQKSIENNTQDRQDATNALEELFGNTVSPQGAFGNILPTTQSRSPQANNTTPRTFTLSNTYLQEALQNSSEISPDVLWELQNALQQKVQWDGNIPTFIRDIQIGDRVNYDDHKQSVTIHNPDGSLKLQIVFKDKVSVPAKLANRPYAQGVPLGEWLMRRGPAKYKKNSCGASVGNLLIEYGIPNMPRSGRHGKNWDTICETPPVSQYFEKVPCDLPTDAPAWSICVYNENATLWSSARRRWWHVEMRWGDGRFYSYYASQNPGGSARSKITDPQEYQRLTGFTGYVYQPKKLD